MLSVPKKANDAMHVSMLEGTDVCLGQKRALGVSEAFLYLV